VKDAYPIATFTWLLCYKKTRPKESGSAPQPPFYCLTMPEGIGSTGVPPLPDAVATEVKRAVKTYNSAGFPHRSFPHVRQHQGKPDCGEERDESCQPTTRFRDRHRASDRYDTAFRALARGCMVGIAHSGLYRVEIIPSPHCRRAAIWARLSHGRGFWDPQQKVYRFFRRSGPAV